MATPTDFPFDPIANPTWNAVLASTTTGFPGQTYSPVLDTQKVDSSVVIDPLLIPAQIGAVWSNTVDTFMRVAWPAIVQVLTGSGGNTFLGLTDVDESDYVGKDGYLVRVNGTPDGLEFTPTIPASQVLDGVTDGDGTKRFFTDDELEATVETREPIITGLLTWGSPGMSKFDNTTVTFEAGTGVQITKSGLTATRTDVTWALQNVVVAGIGTRATTWFTVNTAGTVQQYTAAPPRPVLDNEIFLGVALHDVGIIDRVIPAPTVSADLGQLLYDEISATGVVKITAGGEIDERVSFTCIQRATDMMVPGINFVNDALVPNVVSYAEVDPAPFERVYQDGTIEASPVFAFDIVNYESAPGVLSALTGKQASIQKIVLLADGSMQVQYGNVAYSNFATAKDAIYRDLLENPLNPTAQFIGNLVAVAVAQGSAPDWTLNQAEIIQVGGAVSGGGGGGATPALGDLTDVVIGSPTEGQVISYDGTSLYNNNSLPAQFIFTFDGNVAPATDVGPRAFVYADKFFPLNVRIDVKTAPTTTGVQVDVLKNGTTIFSGGGPTIGVGNFTASKVPLTAEFVAGDEIRINIDAGDTSWQDLSVSLQGNPIPG
jgi:hypothetical protein